MAVAPGQETLVGMQDRFVRRRAEHRQQPVLVLRGILEHGQCAGSAGGDDDAAEAPRLAVVRAQLGAFPRATHRAHRQTKVESSSDPLEHGCDVGAGAAGDGPPPVAPPSEHPVPAEELDERLRREVECPCRRRRPERRSHRHEVVTPEAVRVAVIADVFRERPPSAVLASRAAEKAHDFTQQRGPAAQRPAARPREPATARDRERHLGLLRRDPELGEEPAQVRIVRLVVDDEPCVDGVRTNGDGVDVAAGIRVRLEQLDVVHTRKCVGCAQPGDPGAHDRYIHPTLIRRTLTTRFGS